MADNPFGRNQLSSSGLRSGIAAPFLYFGSQAASAPFYGSYDWKRQLASELGEPGFGSAPVFAAGMGLTGLALALAGVAMSLEWRVRGAGWAMTLAVLATLTSSGGATLWAAAHPWPAANHNPGLWGIGTLLFPLVASLAARSAGAPARLTAYLAFSFVGGTVLAALQSAGAFSGYEGFAQRIAAMAVYPPVGVVAWWLGTTRNRPR